MWFRYGKNTLKHWYLKKYAQACLQALINQVKPRMYSLLCSVLQLHPNASSNAPLLVSACTERHRDISTALASLAALCGFIIVPYKVCLLGAIFTRGTECGGTVAAAGFHLDAALMARAVARVLAVHAVNEGNVVPERVSSTVFKLGNAVGPKEGRVLGDFEGRVAIERLGVGTSLGDGGLVVGYGAPDDRLAHSGQNVVRIYAYRTTMS